MLPYNTYVSPTMAGSGRLLTWYGGGNGVSNWNWYVAATFSLSYVSIIRVIHLFHNVWYLANDVRRWSKIQGGTEHVVVARDASQGKRVSDSHSNNIRVHFYFPRPFFSLFFFVRSGNFPPFPNERCEFCVFVQNSQIPSSSSVLLRLHQRPGREEQDLLHPGQHVRWYMWREPGFCYPWQHVQEHVSGHPGHHCHWHKQITLETCDLSIA